MYLRFVITQIDSDSRQPQGLFIAARELLDSGHLTAAERLQIQQILMWFNQNLPVPNEPYIRGRVTFWFHAEAQECIGRMWELANLLRLHGYLVEVQKCQHLHNRVYSDQYQVAAYPSAWDGKRTSK